MSDSEVGTKSSREIPERPESFTFSEANEETWRQYFAEFREKVWPMFKEHGFTPSEAFFAWELNQVNGALGRIEDKLDESRL